MTEPVPGAALNSRAGADGFPPALFSPPIDCAAEDDLIAGLSLFSVEEINTLFAVSSLPILTPLVSLLVGMALRCHSDRQTCRPVRDIFMT